VDLAAEIREPGHPMDMMYFRKYLLLNICSSILKKLGFSLDKNNAFQPLVGHKNKLYVVMHVEEETSLRWESYSMFKNSKNSVITADIGNITGNSRSYTGAINKYARLVR